MPFLPGSFKLVEQLIDRLVESNPEELQEGRGNPAVYVFSQDFRRNAKTDLSFLSSPLVTFTLK
ncbi:hypothetical protein J22TS1_05090 [Siminovitchia terrae]|nr:hypothetical protein J22TS1_05090 [Siminovitchia terrae]